MWARLWPFLFVILVTIILVIPDRLLKARYKKYIEKMKEVIWTDNYEKIDKELVRTKMVEFDKELHTTGVREKTYNAFVAAFAKELLAQLNETTYTNRVKINRIDKAISLLTMNFEVESLQELQAAKDKLKGNVKV